MKFTLPMVWNINLRHQCEYWSKVLLLVFYCCVTNYHKPTGLKQCPLISSQCCRPKDVGRLSWVLCLGSFEAKIKVSAKLSSYLDVLGKSLLRGSFRLLADWFPCKFRRVTFSFSIFYYTEKFLLPVCQ